MQNASADPAEIFARVRAAAARIAQAPPLRPERLSGIHNPWGVAATLTDAWSFLDLCESPVLVDEIARLIGPDVILWDSQLHLSAADYAAFVAAGREGRYWPANPLAGAVALVALDRGDASAERPVLRVARLQDLNPARLAGIAGATMLYVVRYMPATSRFVRDPDWPANRTAMLEQPLINYTNRPLWLVRGEDRANNDFVTGFATVAPRWASR